MLNVGEYVRVVERLRLGVERVLVELDRDARFVQGRAEKKFLEIAAEREKLEQQENAAKLGICDGLRSCQDAAGLEVIRAIREIESTMLEWKSRSST